MTLSGTITLSGDGRANFKVGDPIEVVAARRARPNDEDDLSALALTAITTPLLDAEAALAVLADLLLEREMIPMAKHLTPIGDLPTPAEKAFEWATTRLARTRHLTYSKLVITSISGSVITVGPPDDITITYRPPTPAPRLKRQHRGINGAPLAMRAKLKPWERR